MRAGFPKELIDGSGLDLPVFERLPEQQLDEDTVHRLYCLKKEYAKAGIPDPELAYIEGIFVPTEPGAVTWREQMDHYSRWTLISLAYGVKRLLLRLVRLRLRQLLRGGALRRLRHPAAHSLLQPQAGLRRVRHADRQAQRGRVRRLAADRLLDHLRPAVQAARGGPVYALWTLRGKRPVTIDTERPRRPCR